MNADWFAGRLRELREAKGLDRARLAEMSGMTVGGLRDLELGVRSPTWRTVAPSAGRRGGPERLHSGAGHGRPPRRGGRPRRGRRETHEKVEGGRGMPADVWPDRTP